MKKILFTSVIQVLPGVDPAFVLMWLVDTHFPQIMATGFIEKITIGKFLPADDPSETFKSEKSEKMPMFVIKMISHSVESGKAYNDGPRPGIKNDFVLNLLTPGRVEVLVPEKEIETAIF